MTPLEPSSRPLTRSPTFLAACAAVALLGIASFVALVVFDEPFTVRGTPRPDDAVAAEAAPVAAPAPALPPVAPPAATAPAPLPPEEIAVRRARAQEQHAQEAKAPAITRLMPSRARAIITHAIENQAPQLSECFEERTPERTPDRAQERTQPASRRADARAEPRLTRGEARLARIGALSRRRGAGTSVDALTILRLDIEPQHGELWIYDAAVEKRGGATDAQLACARRALRGLAIELPGTTPGPHVAMSYPIP